MKFKLRAYMPGPLRCKNCLQYNHTSKNCSNKPRCLHCGKQGHNIDNCGNHNEADIRCANCGGGHTADDKSCLKYIQVRDRLQKEAAGRRQTYSRALVGDINTVAVTAAGAPNVATQTVNQQQIDKTITELKSDFDFENSLEKFASQITDDIQKVLHEFGNEIKIIKTAVTEIRDFQKEIETKMHTLESTVELNDVRVDNLVKENYEMKNHISQIHAHLTKNEKQEEQNAITREVLKQVKRYTTDCVQFLISNLCDSSDKSASFKRMKDNTLRFHKLSTESDNLKTHLSDRYWSTN